MKTIFYVSISKISYKTGEGVWSLCIIQHNVVQTCGGGITPRGHTQAPISIRQKTGWTPAPAFRQIRPDDFD